MFVSGKPFQPSLLFTDKTEAYLRMEHLASSANIRLGWKGLQRTNTIFLQKSVNFGRKKFYSTAPSFLFFLFPFNHNESKI